MRELGALYKSLILHEPSPLAELEIQYPDYASWQRERLQGELLDEELSYWKNHLRGELPILQLPTDYPRPPAGGYRGGRRAIHLSKDLKESLKDIGRSERATLFMTLLAAYATLLYRYSNQTDIIIGAPLSNRTQSETEGLIGFFVNPMPLRC